MEPIQDDMPTEEALLGEAVATGGFEYAVRHVYEDALDRLVAERDRWKQKWIEDTSALEEERDAAVAEYIEADQDRNMLLSAREALRGRVDELVAERDRLIQVVDGVAKAHRDGGFQVVTNQGADAMLAAHKDVVARRALTKTTEEEG